MVQFDLDFQSPLIFDDSLDFSDPEESRFVGAYSDGLLTKSGGVLSMSAFDKSQKGEFSDSADDTSNVFQDTTGFVNCSQTSYGTPLFTPVLDGSFNSDDDSLQYLSNNGYSGSPFEFRRSPSLESHSRPLPEITSFFPVNGCEGTKISVYLQSMFDLLSPPTWTFSLMFGSFHCDCVIAPLGSQDSKFQYALLADVPSFVSVGCVSVSVPLQLVVNDNETPTPQIVRVGSFMYQQEVSESSPRKRRMSVSSDETSESVNSKHPRIHENLTVPSHSDRLSASPYSPYLPTPTSMSGFSGQYQQMSRSGQFETYLGLAQARANSPSPLASSWSPSVSTATVSTSSPCLSAIPISQESEASTAANPPNPTLVRTSTIQQTVAGNGGSTQQPFNPYSMYPSKAVLKLNGNLDSMVEDWAADEKECQRRLVHFTRHQDGSAIHADFKPVAPADRAPNSICISCIYWAGKDECFVTSVDTIYLLESLVGVRFTVEEKNRIRRNLEGFRPLTVSKAKAESEDFFKVIMGFPAPKPRNIEKDVKVFPWKILSHALKKIIGKYSASYSSTASPLPTPLGLNYVASRVSDSGLEVHAGSPHSAAAAPAPIPAHETTQYNQAAGPMANGTQIPAAANYLPIIVSSGPQHGNLTASYNYPETERPLQPSPIMVPSHGSFDFSAYINHNPMGATYRTV